ncbi:hypothetical protein AB7849_16795 [Rhodanobacter sp. 115]|uniref:hypothetical protein n=1 Tax=Rhodanobacter sp. FW021-MT20 TaxID=1162282 RepID=UPI0012F92353|nr:hypothetical protein [Rhodanobacter sp. 115]
MNTTDLDGISLEQALIDFEVANARVIDLTSRLTSLSRELIQARTELATVKLRGAAPVGSPAHRSIDIGDMGELARLRDTLNQVRTSRLVRAACMFSGKLRKVLA